MIYLLFNKSTRLTYCDQCYKPFEINIKIKYLGEGIVRRYFCCEHCSAMYTVAYINNSIRSRHKKLNRIRRQIQMTQRMKVHKSKLLEKEERLEELSKAAKKLMLENKEEHDRLVMIYE